MRNGSFQDPGVTQRVYGSKEDASFQIIVLGPNGGPREDSVTGLLVRAPQAEWRKGSVIAVDAGAHLATIVRILQQYMPLSSEEIPETGYSKLLEEGPFAGIQFPHLSARNNALYVFRELLHSFLITHPHLDHLSGIAINTPALEFGREAKAITALPSTIEAIKSHIFNDSIWPNLSDEAHGVGLVTYKRLIEGGNPRLGSGEARGYVSVCDGLATKCWSVSHGKCQRRNHSHTHQRGESAGWFSNDYAFPPRRLSRMSDDHNYFTAMAQQQAYNSSASFTGSQIQMPPGPLTPGAGTGPPSNLSLDRDYLFEPVSSSAFFIRNDSTGHEILVFGDVEPDSVSISPRNHIVWEDAAIKIASGRLKAIFIECSYDDKARDEDLYGHLCPRHLIAELKFLAGRVTNCRNRKNDGPQHSGIADTAVPPINLQDPPSQAEVARKRKRALNGEAEKINDEPSAKTRPIETSNMPQYIGRKSSTRSGRRGSSAALVTSPVQLSSGLSRTSRHVQFSNSISLTQAEIESGMLPPAAVNPPPRTGQPLNPDPMSSQVYSLQSEAQDKLAEPLKGLSVHIIHVKDTMLDGPYVGQIILEQLRSQASTINLGCKFDMTDCGETIWI